MIDTLLEVGWLLVAVLVPLAVNLWAKQPFEPAKAALLRSLVWLMAAVWLAGCALRWRSPRRDLAGNRLLWPALGVAAALVLSTLLAEDRGLSLVGNYERAQGALTGLSYVLLFLVISARLRTMDQARRLVGAMVATAGPLIALGLAQALGWDPLGLVTDARSPVYATLGRSNYAGAYLAMLLPLTLALTLAARRRETRLLGGALLGGEVVVLALALARGAWLAAAVGLAVFGLAWFWPRLGRPWRWATAAAGLGGLGVGLGALLWLGEQGGSAAARLTIWRATLDLIGRRPLVGYGPDALGLVFPRVFPPQLVYYQGRGVMVDRAHNLFLDWLATGGVVGLIAGLAMLGAFLVIGWRAAQNAADPGRRALLAACLAAVAGNAAGALVSFDVTPTAAASWMLMAVVAGLVAASRAPARTAPAAAAPAPPGWVRAALAAGLVILALAGVVAANVRPQAADVAAHLTDRRAAAADWPAAAAAAERAVALWSGEPAHRLNLAWAYLQQALAGDKDPLPWLRRAEAELLAARALRPGDYQIAAALGELYGVWGSRWDPARLPQADEAYAQAAALAPTLSTVYVRWGMMALETGQLDEAAVRFRQAVDLDATDGYAFAHLGDVEMALGRPAEACAAYAEAAHWAPDLIYAHLGLARCRWYLGDDAGAWQALDAALALDPTHPAAEALRREMGPGP